MDRAEIEVRLLDDEEFRAKLLGLKEAQKKVQEAQVELRLVRGHFRERVRELVNDVGLPVASVARWVDLPAQTIQLIVRPKSAP